MPGDVIQETSRRFRQDRGGATIEHDDNDYDYSLKALVLFLCYYKNITCRVMEVPGPKHVADRYARK